MDSPILVVLLLHNIPNPTNINEMFTDWWFLWQTRRMKSFDDSAETHRKQIKATHKKMVRLEGLSLLGKRDYPERVSGDNEEA